MTHRLDPLLRPRSVAVVGASARPESMGEWALGNLLKGGFEGPVYPVNPGYEELAGLRAYATLAELPEVPDLVIFGIGDRGLEAALDEAIAAGVPAAVIMSSTVLDDDEPPGLRARLAQKIAAAGMVVCGSNGMGFYNVRDRVWASGFDSADHEPPGRITLISHSGAGMAGIIDCDARVRVNLAVSTGNELGATMDEYLDFALDLPETRVVGLFVETARNPDGLRAALGKANAKRIPVVALKVGRTEQSARLTVSHSGAMAGDDAVYDALFAAHGVARVRDMDELATALILFAELGIPGPGGLVALHDSGGERQLLIDLAAEAGVPLARLEPETVRALEAVIDPELPAVNPLDAWSRGGSDYVEKMTRSLALLLGDPNAALGAAVLNRGPRGLVYPMYLDYVRGARETVAKPVALVAARQGTGNDDIAVSGTHEGIPVLDGVATFLAGAHALFAYRDFLERDPPAVAPLPDAVAAAARKRLAAGVSGERAALEMLADLGLPAVVPRPVASPAEARAMAADCGFPVVLKTAKPGIAHKTDVGGVVLDLRSADAVAAAYEELAARLGPAAVVAPMVAPGVEMILGARRDPQFGPVVMLGFGGVLAETLNDVAFLLPPFGPAEARRSLDGLKLRKLLDGVRGRPPADVDAFCDVAARFSAIVAALGDAIAEIDVNPAILGENGVAIVDALIVPCEPAP